jgi:hypothetical protein
MPIASRRILAGTSHFLLILSWWSHAGTHNLRRVGQPVRSSRDDGRADGHGAPPWLSADRDFSARPASRRAQAAPRFEDRGEVLTQVCPMLSKRTGRLSTIYIRRLSKWERQHVVVRKLRYASQAASPRSGGPPQPDLRFPQRFINGIQNAFQASVTESSWTAE